VTLERVALGKLDVKELLKSRPRPAPPSRRARIRPTVAFDDQASETATLIQIVAEDRPGLLHDLAQAISAAGANIELVLVDTEAHKALDVFFVTKDGRKLAAGEQSDLQQQLAARMRGGG
jgi:[protein-PII] uridylyltransferase